MKFVRL